MITIILFSLVAAFDAMWIGLIFSQRLRENVMTVINKVFGLKKDHRVVLY